MTILKQQQYFVPDPLQDFKYHIRATTEVCPLFYARMFRIFALLSIFMIEWGNGKHYGLIMKNLGTNYIPLAHKL